MNALAELHLLQLFLIGDQDTLVCITEELVDEFKQLYGVSEKEIYAVLRKWNYKFGILDYGVSMRIEWLATYDMDFGERLLRVFSSISQRLEII